MNILKDLAAKNPGLPLYDVHDAAFAPYGRGLSPRCMKPCSPRPYQKAATAMLRQTAR